MASSSSLSHAPARWSYRPEADATDDDGPTRSPNHRDTTSSDSEHQLRVAAKTAGWWRAVQRMRADGNDGWIGAPTRSCTSSGSETAARRAARRASRLRTGPVVHPRRQLGARTAVVVDTDQRVPGRGKGHGRRPGTRSERLVEHGLGRVDDALGVASALGTDARRLSGE